MKIYQILLSAFNLAPNSDPDAESAKLIREAKDRVANEIAELKKPLTPNLDHNDPYRSLPTIDLEYYKGGLQGDMNRIGGDFRKAASKLMGE